MTDTNLRDYLENLVEDGAAIVVDEPVSPEYDAPKRSAATCRPLVFNDLGNGWRGAMNLVSDRATIARALDLPPDRVLPSLASSRFDGEVAIDGRLTTAPVDLGAIPIMKHYPRDAGPYITAGIVFSRYGGVQNASIHRMLVGRTRPARGPARRGTAHVQPPPPGARRRGGAAGRDRDRRPPGRDARGLHPRARGQGAAHMRPSSSAANCPCASAATACSCPTPRSCSRARSDPRPRTRGRSWISRGPTIRSGSSP